MTRYLFIGGPLDGRREPVDNSLPEFRCFEHPHPGVGTDPSTPLPLTEHRYLKAKIWGPLTDTTVFWHQDGTCDPIAAMVRKYPHPDTVAVNAADLENVLSSIVTIDGAVESLARIYDAFYEHLDNHES